MQWDRNFSETHPEAMAAGPVPIGTVMETLRQALGGEEVPADTLSALQQRIQRENARYRGLDEGRAVPMEHIRIRVIRIPVTERTRPYVRKDFVVWNGRPEDIYAVYEEQTGYFYCNSGMLHLEIAMARGISSEDVQRKTQAYREYAALMERYIRLYSGREDRPGLA